MYFVKYGKDYLHDPRDYGRVLLDLSFECEENSCGYCDFTIYSNHPMYAKLKERDVDNPVEVYDDDILLFTGFIYELGKEFYLDGHVKCKGELDYLRESIIRPYSTLERGYGNKAPTDVGKYFEWLIDQHNSQVTANRQFVVGINQASALDSNNYIYRENDEYPNTIDEIKEKLLDRLGGFLVVRHQNGVRYIDYLAEWSDSNSQILDFGVNLTDYTQTDDAQDLATFVIPIGAKLNETDYSYDDGYFKTSDNVVDSGKTYYTKTERGYSECSDLTAFEVDTTYYEYDPDQDESNLSLTVEGLADGEYGDPGYKKTGDMIYCESAVRQYGWIGMTYKNTDITVKENLAKSGIIALKEVVSPKRTIEIKAVDMHLVNPSIKPIKIGEYVRVRSRPHNLDSYFLCVNVDLDLNNPENSLYTLGTTFDTLTGQQNKKINELNSAVNKQYYAADKAASEALSAVKTANNTKNQLVNVESSLKDEISEKTAAVKSEASRTYSTKTELASTNRTIVSLSNNVETNYATKVEVGELGTSLTSIATRTSATETNVSTLQQTASGFAARLDTIQAEGRNMFQGSQFFTGDKWDNLDNWWTWDSGDLGFAEYGRRGSWLGITQEIEVEEGKQYTFSFWAKGDEAARINIYTDWESTATTPAYVEIGEITDEYVRYSATFTANQNGVIYPRVENSVDESWLQVYGLKFEKGSVATAWSQSAEEAASAVGKASYDASKTATNYLEFSEESGLVVGDMTSEVLGKNVAIDADSVDIRSGTEVLASYKDSGVEFKKKATFKADGITIDNGDAFAELGKNQILWSHETGFWMQANQSISLSSNISRQLSGVVFVWCYYADGAPQNSKWKYFYVPKSHVFDHPGDGIYMSDPYLGMMKYLYVSNGLVSGCDENSARGTSNGIAYANANYVLRYVIGV